ncbi:peptidase M28 family protein [Sphingomonas sp. S17]|uniref:Carboxypeptidase Q n=3 Tax=Sphingomonas TaxID=13687 RepID=A0A411LFY2_SPHPI|nr:MULTISPECIES: M20/M25/M40 family metallo-hydrolase [Sphingomonas]EGI56748.1 peptidase M28 family protein [Sphingomonas sp. S17]MBQ1480068.1 M20/M25/M40 family metallo-hydrolase [Sphingomonas sp.]MCM3679029.1 M20/M25/M40 family metallo-hydrolase [Sphingomonas paucimobilis]MDG5971783.1 M20/M25/M40 family metallo-hydrolase [Sphingomonas paucimobilis]NNG58207.1 M20/M25/M40 family metallo-hydrolase [Sphingomonas paucimobilis]
MKRFVLAALTATALATPTLAQRTPPPPPAQVAPEIERLRDAALNDTIAWDIVEGLTTEVGQRLAGTEAEERARQWAVARLTALGFKNVRIEPYRMPVWERGAESAEIVSPFPQKLTLAALGNSAATSAAGLTAEVAVFPSIAAFQSAPDSAIKGRIVYIGNAMPRTQDGSGYGAYGTARFTGPALAAQRGAVAIVIRSIGTDHHRFPHTGTTNFPDGVKPIPAAALSVPDAEQLERIAARGGPVRMKLVLTPRMVGSRESGNVIAEVPGSDPSAGIVLVGGHLDSWDQGTGAIDDASGIAITAAAAKRIMDAGTPRRTIRVVWFGAEEVGGLGGAAYAKAHASERHATASESDFGADRIWRFEVNLPAAALPIADRLQTALAPLGIARGSGLGGDGTDIGPTLKLGTAAIDLNQSGWDYFDTHHTPDDVLDRVDPAALRQNVAAWTAMLAVVANAPEPIDAVRPR